MLEEAEIGVNWLEWAGCTGIDWNRLEWAGIGWNRHKEAGKGSNRLD